MQIDFHHAVTYVAARLAGMPADQATTVAHAAQYVDDATNDGPLEFEDGQRYVRVTSAHKTLDIRDNSDYADNRFVWVPFHFLPGGENPVGNLSSTEAFTRRLMCKPDSQVAREMMADCILKNDLPFALHRLGIALHTYADTWAHQQFVGMVCDLNRIRKLEIVADDSYVNDPVYKDLTGGTTMVKQYLANHLPVGHAGAVTLPDMPFLKWRFTRENGETVGRDNPTDFLCAAASIFNMVRRYLAGDPQLPESVLTKSDLAKIRDLFTTTLYIDGEDRHSVWLDAIRSGAFSFGPEELTYVEQGPGSWKFKAIGQDPDQESGDERFQFKSDFLTSDWKRFHDAVQFQRLFILHDLLPRFGLCAS